MFKILKSLGSYSYSYRPNCLSIGGTNICPTNGTSSVRTHPLLHALLVEDVIDGARSSNHQGILKFLVANATLAASLVAKFLVVIFKLDFIQISFVYSYIMVLKR